MGSFNVSSNGNTLFVKFKSNNGVSADGFIATIHYVIVNCATVSNGDDRFCNCYACSENEGDCDYNHHCQNNHFCGSNNCLASLGFDSEIDCCSSTQIMSPNYPNSYPDNAEETWLISAPNGSIINLQFHSFHVRFIVESIYYR